MTYYGTPAVSGTALTWDGNSYVFDTPISASGGGGVPGGNPSEIQFNSAGAFGGVPDLTWDGALLIATGTFKGDLNGTASLATSALTASYVLNAITSSYAITAASLTAQVFNVALNGTANGITTNIGGIYIPATTLLTTKSLAYIGGSQASETATLHLVPINTLIVSASWSRTNVLGSAALTGSVSIGPGWYDIVLSAGSVSETTFARGLYLTSGDI